MKSRYWMNSECVGSWLHRFQTLADTPEGSLEICEICKMKVFFKVHEGRIDNYNYVKYHARELLTPWMPYFYHEYTYGQS